MSTRLRCLMVNFAFFDSNEHTMHAERDAVLTIPSVHLSVIQSVCLSSVLCLNEWIYIYMVTPF